MTDCYNCRKIDKLAFSVKYTTTLKCIQLERMPSNKTRKLKKRKKNVKRKKTLKNFMPRYGKILGHDSKPRSSRCNDSSGNSLITACRNRSQFAKGTGYFIRECSPQSPLNQTDPRTAAQAAEVRTSPQKTSPNERLGVVKHNLVQGGAECPRHQGLPTPNQPTSGNGAVWGTLYCGHPSLLILQVRKRRFSTFVRLFIFMAIKKKRKNGPRVVRVAPEELHGDIVKKVTEYVKHVKRLL